MGKKAVILLISIFLLSVGVLFYWPAPKVEAFCFAEGKTILFVGDIYLGRWIEPQLNKNSVLYPFQKVSHLFRGIDIVFGNLEGPIVKKKIKVPHNSLIFQFSPEVIKGLTFSNFNLLSLANNHTFNRGKKGLKETREFLSQNGINTVGDPMTCDGSFTFQKENIKFLAFNNVYPWCEDKEAIIKAIRATRTLEPDLFIVTLIHWGKEYRLKSHSSQREFAHQLIEAGADLIIGTHPHVVQEIELYKGKLIFYSLGNFIFPQYFSKETQQSLAVGLEIYPEEIIFRFFPIQSHLSQPFLMKEKEAKKFLEELAKKSDKNLFNQIKNGIIKIEK